MAGTHGVVSLHIARGKDPWVPWRPVLPKAQLMIEALIRGLTVPSLPKCPLPPGTIGVIEI